MAMAVYSDYTDSSHRSRRKYKNYDLLQNYLVKYNKERFRKLTLWTLFKHNMKIAHPLISIFYLFNPTYNKKMRVMDYYITLIMPIFFTFIKIYLDGNPDYEVIKMKRDIRTKNLSINDIPPSIIKVKLFYSDILKSFLQCDYNYFNYTNTHSP